MDKKENFKRIRAGVVLNCREELHTPEFFEHLRDWEKQFDARIYDEIVRIIGEEGWAIYFVQVNQLTDYWFCDIYIDNLDYFIPIKHLCENHLDKELKIDYCHRGTVATYMQV